MTAQVDRLSGALAGRYRIERELGAGGMATVYLAEDLKHDRKVAIKVLKPELAAVLGAERFVVEIKTTAAMSHPHILPLFDSGTADGFLFYVMPYIQGETIREKLNRETQFGVDEAVRIAREVADALDYAHRHGVIHRDIKPENILLHDGRAMVMDFGIALAVSAAAGGRMTETGLSLGTPHYMSPEQATAEKEITARSDQYSLASVLYEMLAGDPPFVASAAQAVIMKIITEPAPPVTTRRKNVPANVDAALGKALEKLPADRFESAKAFADALANPAFAAGGGPGGLRSGAKGAYVPRQWFLAAAVALVTTLAALGWSLSRDPDIPDTPVIRTTFEVGPGATLRDAGGAIAITRDGSRMAYLTRDSSGAHVLTRRTDELVGRELVNREVHSLAFSFDGRWLAFIEGVKLMKVSVDGGPVVQVADMTGLSRFPRGLTWTSRGEIIAGWSRGAHIVTGAGGAMRPAFSVPDSFPNALNPIALPDPGAIAYTAGHSFESSRIAFASLATGRVEITNIPGAQVLGVLDSRLIYVTLDGALMSLPFDVERSRPAGEPEPLGSEVRTGANFGAVAALSASGTLVFNRGMFDLQMLLVSPTGGEAPLYKEVRGYAAPRFSPDGKRVAVGASNAGATEIRDIWVYDLEARTFSRLTSVGTGGSSRSAWSPDGKRVFFLKSVAEGLTQIMAVPSDGSGAPEVIAKPSTRISNLHVSPDGKRIIYTTGTEIVSRGLTSDTNPVVLVSGPGRLADARTSPDGRWLAYNSNETGQQQIYVRLANGTGAKVQVSDGGGFEPMWSRSGRSLYFRRPGQIVEVPILPGAVFAVGTPRVVVRGEYLGAFDITPDGRAFVMVGSANAIASPVIIHNWGRELREKFMAGRP